MTWGPIFSVGFSDAPGSWYTIDAWRARNARSSRSVIFVTSSPADEDPARR